MADYWFDSEKVNQEVCRAEFEKYKDTLPLIAKIFVEILYKKNPDNQEYHAYLVQAKFKEVVSFIDIVQMGENWERVLVNLNYFFEQQTSFSTSMTKRLIWYFDPKTKAIEVVEQSLQTKGGWSKGRPVGLKRFNENDPKLDYLTEEDRKCIKTLRHNRPYGWGSYDNYYEWDPVRTPLALVGHPCVYHRDNPTLRIELVSSSPELIIKQQDDDKFHISLSHVASDDKIFIEAETPTRYRVVFFPKSMAPLVEIIGSKGMIVPFKAKDHIVSIIQKASPMLAIHSEIETMAIPARGGDTTPCLQMMPLEQGLKINLFVRPFSDQGPYFRPGHGRSSPLIVLDSQPLKANRCLQDERARADAMITACPPLHLNDDGSDEWSVDDPETCLEILNRIHSSPPGSFLPEPLPPMGPVESHRRRSPSRDSVHRDGQ